MCVLRCAVKIWLDPKGKVKTETSVSNLTGTCDCCQTRLPLQGLPGCGLLLEWGAPAPPGYTDLLDAAAGLFPPLPWSGLALACLLQQDFGGKEQSASEERMC